MKVDDALIDKLARLSKLAFSEEGKEEIKRDLEKMFNFMEKLNEIDTEGIEPLIYVNEEVNVFREDVVKQEITREEALMNAPLKDEQFFKVPKFVKRT